MITKPFYNVLAPSKDIPRNNFELMVTSSCTCFGDMYVAFLVSTH